MCYRNSPKGRSNIRVRGLLSSFQPARSATDPVEPVFICARFLTPNNKKRQPSWWLKSTSTADFPRGAHRKSNHNNHLNLGAKHALFQACVLNFSPYLRSHWWRWPRNQLVLRMINRLPAGDGSKAAPQLRPMRHFRIRRQWLRRGPSRFRPERGSQCE